MSLTSKDAVLYDENGNPLAVQDGDPIPNDTPRLLIAGTDGVNAQTVGVSASGQAAIQDPPNLDVALSTRATETTLSSIKNTDGIKKITDALPIGANLIGKVQLRDPSDTVDLGDLVNPVRVDPTGTTTQPISAAALPLPTGAATETTLATRLAESTFTSRINTLGQKAMAASTPMVIASDQTVIPINDNGGSLTVDTPQLPVTLSGSGNLQTVVSEPLPSGDNTLGRVKITDGADVLAIQPTGEAEVALYDSSGSAISAFNDIGTIRLQTQSKLVNGIVSTNNSTATPLGISGVYTGTGEEILDYASIHVYIFTDQISASSGLEIQFSTNDVTYRTSDLYTIEANSPKHLCFPPEARYFRVKYTNGAVAQTAFELQVVYKSVRSKPTSHRLFEPNLSEDNDSELVKAIITGRKQDGTYVNASFDDDGRLIVADPTAILTTLGFATGYRNTTAMTRVWLQGTIYTEPSTNAQRSLSSSSVSDISAGTGARTARITYLDSTGNGPFTEDVTLNGTTPVDTVATNICFIESMEVLTVGSTGNNVGIIRLFAATGGGGGIVWSVAAADNKTFSAHHYVPIATVSKVTGVSVCHDGTASTSGGLYTLNRKRIGVANIPEIQISDFIRLFGLSSSIARDYDSPLEVLGPARIAMYVTPETASPHIYRGAFDFFDQNQ